MHIFRDRKDRLFWRWDGQGRFTVHSFYKWLEFGGIRNRDYDTVWKVKIPFKIKIFLWLVIKKRVLTRVHFSTRGWQGDISCVFCGEPETVDYLFVQCPFI